MLVYRPIEELFKAEIYRNSPYQIEQNLFILAYQKKEVFILIIHI